MMIKYSMLTVNTVSGQTNAVSDRVSDATIASAVSGQTNAASERVSDATNASGQRRSSDEAEPMVEIIEEEEFVHVWESSQKKKIDYTIALHHFHHYYT